MGSRGGTTQPDNQANMTPINKLTLNIHCILIFLNIYSLLFICCNCRPFTFLFYYSEEMEAIGASHYREHPISIAPPGPV